MHAPILLSMFQCMAVVKDAMTIRELWLRLRRMDTVINLIARPPGSLGVALPMDKINMMQIGSVHFKMKQHDVNLSFIVFNTMKVKVSGGLQKMELFESTTEFWEFVNHALVVPCLKQIFTSSSTFDISTGMVNACSRLGTKLAFNDYLQRIDTLSQMKNKVVIQPTCTSSKKQRGRLCSVRIKRVDKTGTLIIDHHLTLQAFAYRDMNVLKTDVEELACILLKRPVENELSNDVIHTGIGPN